MAQGRQMNEWFYFAALMCVIVNINRDPKKGKAGRLEDFHPFLQKPKSENTGVGDYLGAQREIARRKRLGLK